MKRTAEETRHIRVDQWLDVACIFKTRSQARGACLKGRVSIDGRICKPRRPVKVGDKILFGKYSGTEVKLDDEEYLMMREEDILGIVQ